MSNSEIKTRKLFLHDATYASTYADIYIGRASDPSRSSQKLIIIISYPKSKYAQRSLLDVVIQQAVRAFEDSRHATPELTLESTLESLNIALPELAPRKDPAWLETLSLLVAVSDRGQLHFAQLGEVHALLVQGVSLSIVSEDPGRVNPLKLFSHITSGLLDPGNAMLFTTTPLLDYISEEKIKKLLAEFPPQLVEQQLTSLLAQVPRSVTFASVIVKFTTELDELAARGIATQAAVQRETRMDDFEPEPEPVSARSSRQRVRIERKWLLRLVRFIIRSFATYLVLVYRSVRISLRAVWQTIRFMISNQRREERERLFVERVTTVYQEMRAKLTALPRLSRRALYAVLISSFVLLHILLVKGQRQELERVQTTFDETLAVLSQKKQQVEDAVIYKDDRQAEQLLLEIDGLLRSVVPLDKEQEAQLAQYLAENQRELNAVRHINDIPAPLVAADLSAAGVDSFATLASAPDGGYYVSAGTTLYRWKDNALKSLATAPAPIVSVLLADRTVYALTDALKLYRLSDTSLTPVSLALHAEQKSIHAASLYANNLYFIDQQSESIYKHTGNNGNFGAGTVWAREDVLSAAEHAAIDGNLYVTTRDGLIRKYLRGSRVVFEYHEPNPKLGAGSKLYTNAETNNLYLMDPANRRIIIMDKQGEILDQFTSTHFDRLTDIAVSQSDALAVLSGKMIYLIAIKK